ncbi:hypothetical protein D9611_006350 [Ephemerocybe angulata]|uniref:ENTH domain-containing protein n=1 Tax=Ephemerocybe angulata TaxID=980116 RepID=A0A8H5C6T6_9AGAR|nr:hypothetical protein D9611_006350 [Tulosesus angulatus]
MSSFDKIVKLACKPKAAAPKSKYIDPIIAATWADEGSVSDVCKALVPRIREPNVLVVFKALIVLHTMIRNGSTDNILGYLSQTDILKLKNVAAANWEGAPTPPRPHFTKDQPTHSAAGYATPENVQNYAVYLESRIRAYRDLKHDAIRVQSDTNRDMRNSVLLDEDASISKGSRRNRHKEEPAPSSVSRSKTIMGRKLRVMTVEKGLLRETKIVHHMIDALVECRFYLDDLEDELNILASQMLVKDLLILFQAGNEGVINVLEHYFEMSHIDAEEALLIYRNFCTQTEKVVEYLGVARKLQNLLNVPIPNLKHAPVSLAGALQEYLDDPNFEDNRLEYKANKKITESEARRGGDSSKKNKKSSSVTFKEPPLPTASTSQSPSSPNGASNNNQKDVIDFFSAIEEEQTSMFSAPSSAGLVQPQHTINPFNQMMTGQPFGQAPQITMQQTGFLVPQHTAFQAPNPFNNMLQQQPQQQQQPGHQPFSAFLPAQQTGFPQMQQPQQTGFLQQPQQSGFLQQPQQTGFLQPQTTGSNPFRQSMLVPQTTGMALFANAASNTTSPTLSPNMFSQPNGASSAGPLTGSTSFSSFAPQPSNSTSAFASIGGHSKPPFEVPNRPQSTPLTSMNTGQSLQPVKSHMTGTKNPFGPVITAPPPVPKVPTLMELQMGFGHSNGNANQAQNQQGQQQQQQQQQQQPQTTNSGGFNFASSALNPGPTDISSIASSFTSVGKPSNTASPPQNTTSPLQPQHTIMPSGTPSLFSSSLSNQATSSNSSPFSASAPLKPQTTGFVGLKPFKPSSSFGAELLNSLPPVSSSANTPQPTGTPSSLQPQHTVTPGSAFSPSFSSNLANAGSSTGTNPPQGALNSQSSPTGGANGSSAGSSLFGGSSFSSTLSSQPTGASGPFGTSNFSSTLNSQATGATGSFGASKFSSTLSSQPTGASGSFGTSGFNPNPTGSTLGVGLRPQITGGGAANPFRASMANNGSAFGASPPPQVPALPTQFQMQMGQQQQPFGASGAFSSPFGMGQQGQQPFGQQQGQQQQQQNASLI